MKCRITQLFRLLILIFSFSIVLHTVPFAFAASRQEQLDRKIAQIIAEMPSSADTDSKKALYLHDYIVKNVSYELTGDHQTAFGALLDGKAVCAGYAEAYLKLLTAAGIRAYTITGTADNGDGNLVGHAWTMLYLEGICVFTDVTWDDPFVNGEQKDDYVSYTYFQLSMEDMHRDHFPNNASKALLPSSCNHKGFDYYSVMQGEGTGCAIFNNNTTAQQAAKYFRYLGKTDGKDQFFCDFRFEGTDVQGWIRKNWVSIAECLSLTGTLDISYQYSDTDAKVTLSGTLRTSISVSSVSIEPAKVVFQAVGMTAQLNAVVLPENASDKRITYYSSDPAVAIVSLNGLVTAIGNGTAVITVQTNDGGKTATCTVTVSIQAPTEPTETTVPPITTEQTEMTDPIETTESTVPTVPVVTVPTVPSVQDSIPTETAEPTNNPEYPDETIPADSTDSTKQTSTTTASDDNTATTNNIPVAPVTPPNGENHSNPVIIIALISGAGIFVVSLIYLRKRH
jgi:transglutaminase/protease-like cytokinesis protein 3